MSGRDHPYGRRQGIGHPQIFVRNDYQLHIGLRAEVEQNPVVLHIIAGGEISQPADLGLRLVEITVVKLKDGTRQTHLHLLRNAGQGQVGIAQDKCPEQILPWRRIARNPVIGRYEKPRNVRVFFPPLLQRLTPQSILDKDRIHGGGHS